MASVHKKNEKYACHEALIALQIVSLFKYGLTLFEVTNLLQTLSARYSSSHFLTNSTLSSCLQGSQRPSSCQQAFTTRAPPSSSAFRPSKIQMRHASDNGIFADLAPSPCWSLHQQPSKLCQLQRHVRWDVAAISLPAVQHSCLHRLCVCMPSREQILGIAER